ALTLGTLNLGQLIGQSRQLAPGEAWAHFRVRPGKLPSGLSFAKTSAAGQVIDLSALILTQSRLDGHSPAPPAPSAPVLLRRPPPARDREPCPAAATGCVQKNDGPTQAAPDGSPLLL